MTLHASIYKGEAFTDINLLTVYKKKLQKYKEKIYYYKNNEKHFDSSKKVLTFVKTFKNMTDKEKIELIIQDKHLNSTQFCNEVCIAQGTLSHIRSGRTEPTLNILRSIAQAFPDINPAWLFYGEGSMYKNADSPTPSDGESDDTYLNHIEEPDAASDEGQLSFAFPTSASSPSKSNVVSSPNAAIVIPPQNPGTSRRTSSPTTAVPQLNVQEIVAETLKQQQKPQRKVVEVRIFFDDGTFETFSAN